MDHKKVMEKIAAQEGDQGADFKKMLKVAARSGSEVPRESIINYLEEEMDHNQKCLEFPWIFFYFCFFSCVVLLHEHIVDVSQVERNFNGFLSGTTFEGIHVNPAWPVGGHKDIEDIDLVADVWTYLYDAVFPLFLNPNQTTPRNDLDRVLRYNQLLGGLTLRQVRKERKNCADEHPGLGPFNKQNANPFLMNFDCFPLQSISKECFGPGELIQGFCPGSKAGLGSGGRRLAASKHAARSRLGVGKKGTIRLNPFGDQTLYDNMFVAIFPSHEGLDHAHNRLKQYMANTWIDEQTALLEVMLYTLNPDLGVYTQSTVSIYFPPDGGILPFVQTTSFLSKPYPNALVIVVDVVWALLFLQMTGLFVGRLCKFGCRECFKDMFMLIDCLCVLGGIAIIALWIVYNLKLSDLQDVVAECAIHRPELDPAKRTTPYVDAMDTYFDHIDKMQRELGAMTEFVQVYRIGICWYSLLCVIRFFKAFRSQPRLAVVTQTLENSFVDFVHFFIVFLTMYMSYVISGMFLFGHRMADFSSLELAFTKCFLMLNGDFNFDELMEENPGTAGIWFYTFIIFMVMLLLNMALAIIMDVYGGAKEAASFSDAIWDQLGMMWAEFKAASRGITKMRVIHETLTKMDAEYVGKNEILEAIPTMQEEQATALIAKIEELEEADDESNLTLGDALKLVVSTKINVEDIDKCLSNYITAEQGSRELLLGNFRRKKGQGGPLVLHPESNKRIKSVENRIDVIETFLNEAMCYMVFRGKELRNRLKAIEDKLRGQRDAATAKSDLWQNPPSLLGSRAASPQPPAKLSPAPPAGASPQNRPMTFSA